MKKIIISILMGLALTGCSSGNSDSKPGPGGGVVTQFGQSIAGHWLSECAHNQNGFFVEDLNVNANGSGTRTINPFQDDACTRAIAQQATPENFTYTAATAANGSTPVTLTFADGQKAQVNVVVQGDNLEITSNQGTVRYFRVKEAHQTPGTNPGNVNDFDSVAGGNWVTEQCYTYQNNQTARQVVAIKGQGRVAVVLNVYPSADCIGEPHAEQAQDLEYKVDRFANGGGQITINGKVSDIIFKENKMTLTDAESTTVYIKINN